MIHFRRSAYNHHFRRLNIFLGVCCFEFIILFMAISCKYIHYFRNLRFQDINYGIIIWSLLQKAVRALSHLEQFPQFETTNEVQADKKKEAAQKQEASLKPLENAIVCGLLQHADKDVRLLVAICVAEIFRVRAPEPPFEDKDLKVYIINKINENLYLSLLLSLSLLYHCMYHFYKHSCICTFWFESHSFF